MSRETATIPPAFTEAFWFWLKLGFISFGGPGGQIAIMHSELVERRRWISDERFLHALNYCMLLPGPEAQQLAIYCGWLLHRTWGGIVAGALFVLPSAFILWGLSLVYVSYGHVTWIASIFYGLKPAVVAIVAAAVIRLGRKAVKSPLLGAISAAAFAGMFFPQIPFPVIVLGAGLTGYLVSGFSRPAALSEMPADADTILPHTRPSWLRAAKVTGVCLTLWWTPIFLAGWLTGWSGTLFQEGKFFSKAAMVTFGGAYAVLPYVAQQAVERFGWLTAGQMLDGLALAETTPGPLIMVLQFVGFLGAWNHPGELPPLVAATLGAALTTWATFVPCFLWIFLGAPHIEDLRGHARLTSALSAVGAAVVGVILNLAVILAGQVFFPAPAGVDWFALVVCIVVFAGLIRWEWPIIPVVLGSGFIGLLYRAVFHSA